MNEKRHQRKERVYENSRRNHELADRPELRSLLFGCEESQGVGLGGDQWIIGIHGNWITRVRKFFHRPANPVHQKSSAVMGVVLPRHDIEMHQC